ncbi:MAG: hypothetical protein IPN76_15890 [Saprospiraceae bacterium]|nr:hypothetical protein [Saprospiraceae bacterium]
MKFLQLPSTLKSRFAKLLLEMWVFPWTGVWLCGKVGRLCKTDNVLFPKARSYHCGKVWKICQNGTEMNQKIFSDKVMQFLTIEFPEFVQKVTYQNDDSFDCELDNPSGQFSMWIATYNEEITFGLKSPNGATDIHTHVSCYEEDIDDCLTTLTKLIIEVKSNKVVMYKNEYNLYDWIDVNRLAQIENKRQKIFEKILWDDKKT